MSTLFTIGELSDCVGWVLSQTGAGHQRSGRITALPDIRTLRYYNTRGLLAPPEEIQGRTAFYGRKHLVQAVAIKRLQLQGESLQTIQQRVVGATNKQLEKWANIPDTLWDQLDQLSPKTARSAADRPSPSLQTEKMSAPPTLEDAASEAPRAAFWKTTPTATPPASAETTGHPALQWELAPGIRVTWDNAQQAQQAQHDPNWQQALNALAQEAARIRHQAGHDPTNN